MVTSNKIPDKKIVKMAEQSSGVVVPQRTLLGEVNEHLACPLCRGYYVDATTIVECLHSFCRSCIIKHLQVKSYCPVCEMMINSAKPNIKLDKALQDIVYKLVPGLFQKEMERRQQFYASRPGPAASATPEQRGEDTERIIFSPEDVISFSLEYVDATDADSISSKSSDSNEPHTVSTPRRYLQCPAVVNISHLKKFLSLKFDVDSTQFAIDILHKRVSLPDYYTLMDIAYIYNWKRNEPLRFVYQIIDYVAIRNRIFNINRKHAHISSPARTINDQGSEASSGTDSPMPDDKSSKQVSNISTNSDKSEYDSKLNDRHGYIRPQNSLSTSHKNNEDVEKSQFLISFELTAKNNSTCLKMSPEKTNTENVSSDTIKNHLEKGHSKVNDCLKRKLQTHSFPEIKKLKIELERAKIPEVSMIGHSVQSNQFSKNKEPIGKLEENEDSSKSLPIASKANKMSSSLSEPSSNTIPKTTTTTISDSLGTKRSPTTPHSITSPKHKTNNEPTVSVTTPAQKTILPLKPQISKPKPQSSTSITTDITKHTVKKIPDLKPSFSPTQPSQNKAQATNKIRMDLLANNSDPTIDRSKILSQVKSSLGIPNPEQMSGDPLKTLFDSCKINIPSSLSITLTDQKQDTHSSGESSNSESKKTVVNKNLGAGNSNIARKAPSPPVHNYIEILKVPESDPKKQCRPGGTIANKTATSNKPESSSSQSKPPVKSTETTAKGPIPNLKPIADTKSAKQCGNSAITFQQKFEQQLLQSEKKPKLPKNKAQVPKLMPANPKSFSNATKLINSSNKSSESSAGAALDLTTPSILPQSSLNPNKTKAFENMQSIANLAKNIQSYIPTCTMPSIPNISTRPLDTAATLKHPSMASVSQSKPDKSNKVSGLVSNTLRHEVTGKSKSTSHHNAPTPSSSYLNPLHNNSMGTTQPTPRLQTRSPSSSPKLVIAEDKNSVNSSDTIVNQSNQISSTQLSNMNLVAKSELPKVLPGPSKPLPKPMKPMSLATKIGGMRQPIPTLKPNPPQTDFQLLSAHHAMLKHQMEMNWLKARQYMTHAHAQKEFNNDKQ